jgi:1,4-dihydroxy-2-naphthoate polyprenyltransferase
MNSTFWKGFWQLADPKIWTASIVPFILGTSIAVSSGFQIHWEYTLLAILVIILVEIGKNGVNEYFDFKSGADLYVTAENRTQFSGGKKVIVDRLLSLQQVRWISILCLLGAVVCSIPILVYSQGILWFGLAGIFLSIAYSMPPLQLCYRGLGEITVGLTFGPIIVAGAYFLQAKRIDVEPIILSIPLAFLISNVLWINEIPDVEADRQAGKMNLVARRGRDKAIDGYIFIFALAYVAVIICAIVLKQPFLLAALLTSLLAIKAVKVAKKNIHNTSKLISANALTIVIYLTTGVLMAITVLTGHKIFH